LIDQGTKNLTVINNNTGNGEVGLAALIAAGQVRKMICSYPRSSHSKVFPELYRAGRIELELVPQGTLAERIRAGGAGIPAFYTPAAVGTPPFSMTSLAKAAVLVSLMTSASGPAPWPELEPMSKLISIYSVEGKPELSYGLAGASLWQPSVCVVRSIQLHNPRFMATITNEGQKIVAGDGRGGSIDQRVAVDCVEGH